VRAGLTVLYQVDQVPLLVQAENEAAILLAVEAHNLRELVHLVQQALVMANQYRHHLMTTQYTQRKRLVLKCHAYRHARD